MEAKDEALGGPAARHQPGEENRELHNKLEKERELNRGWWLSRVSF